MVNWLKKLFSRKPKIFLGLPEGNLTIVERSRYAQELLANPLWRELFREIRRNAVDRWENVPLNAEGKEYCWLTIQVIKDVYSHMVGCITAAQNEQVLREQKEQDNG